ncbi:MAG: hypothetical protein KI789_00810, partial [Hoeflea sp.]|nr:hypothetical protein [Hoeflea sp.]
GISGRFSAAISRAVSHSFMPMLRPNTWRNTVIQQPSRHRLLRRDHGADIVFVLFQESEAVPNRMDATDQKIGLGLSHLPLADLLRVDPLPQCDFAVDLRDLSNQ